MLSIVLQNYSRLLRPGGRMLTLNVFSSYSTPYVIMLPLCYIDYFVMNRFVDCSVYIIVYREAETSPAKKTEIFEIAEHAEVAENPGGKPCLTGSGLFAVVDLDADDERRRPAIEGVACCENEPILLLRRARAEIGGIDDDEKQDELR
jgi:hypothetical protein